MNRYVDYSQKRGVWEMCRYLWFARLREPCGDLIVRHAAFVKLLDGFEVCSGSNVGNTVKCDFLHVWFLKTSSTVRYTTTN